MIMAGLSAWAASDPESVPVHAGANLYQGKLDAIDRAIPRAFAAQAVVVALAYCHQRGRAFTPAKAGQGFVANLLTMMGHVDPETSRPDSRQEHLLDRLWILYADHEMTNSTAAFLHASSTQADPISCLVAAAAAGSGPLHAGAIDIAYKSFERIGSKENVPQLIADVKAKKLRLFGYGHRIYKTVDPRAKFLQDMMKELEAEVGKNRHLSVAMEIDRIAAKDNYFTSRNLKANADLYGCFVYSALYVVALFKGLRLTRRKWI